MTKHLEVPESTCCEDFDPLAVSEHNVTPIIHVHRFHCVIPRLPLCTIVNMHVFVGFIGGFGVWSDE